MIADKKLTDSITPLAMRALTVAIELESNLLDVTTPAIGRKLPDATDWELRYWATDLVRSGLMDREGRDGDKYTRYRVTQAGYARAGVKPPLWVA